MLCLTLLTFYSFFFGQSNTSLIAISGIHEIIEYDISGPIEADSYSDDSQKVELVR